ncbi:TPA: tail fiber domain-containing protein [Raoultella ornithinolytica]|nr:tail fiber domain-containing protein [Raoultella ornithinolytica]
MANISDELAASIQRCFDRTYVDLANQQQFLFGTGSVTVTKPDGTTGSVMSWSQFLSEYANRLEVTDKTWSQFLSEYKTRQTDIDKAIEDAGNDAARTSSSNIFKKEQTFSEGVKFEKTTQFGGNMSAKQIAATSIELSNTTPYIDFHCGNSTADYTHRIIADDPVALKFDCSLHVLKNIRAQEGIKADLYVRAASRTGLIAQYDNDPSANLGDIRVAPQLTTQFATVGADSNGQAGGNLWFEEQVGTNHRLVTQVKGYGATVQYWHHRSDGQIWNSSRGDVQWAAASDKNLKHAITPTDGEQSLANIKKMELVTFVYNDDDQERVRRGVIAQQIQQIDPNYVKTSSGCWQVPARYNEAGELLEPEHTVTREFMVLDTNPLLMDALAAIKVLSKRVEELEVLVGKDITV